MGVTAVAKQEGVVKMLVLKASCISVPGEKGTGRKERDPLKHSFEWWAAQPGAAASPLN